LWKAVIPATAPLFLFLLLLFLLLLFLLLLPEDSV
jgi:hypothetical protein